MTKQTRTRFGFCLALVLLSSETSTRIQASPCLFHASYEYRSKVVTRSLIDEALLETRGGWFRLKSFVKDDNTTKACTGYALDSTARNDLGTIDSTLTESTPVLLAAELRKKGIESHNEGKFEAAAQQFHEAANLLESQLGREGGEKEIDSIKGAWSTCCFHESLCWLKAEKYDSCVAACTSLLDCEHPPPAMIRGRAFHRRAKALVGLGDIDAALVDARSAAFLGDSNGVAFYGKLLRDTGGKAPVDTAFPSADMSALLEAFLGKSQPMVDSGSAVTGSGSELLTSSLLGSLGGLRGLGVNPLGSGGGKGGGSAAKGVLKSLSEKLEDESTHEGICSYLQSINPLQVQSIASMVGLQLSSRSVIRLVNLVHGITPKTIKRTVKLTRHGLWGVQLVRKIMALMSKYRHLFFLLFLFQWTLSAVFQPTPMLSVKAKGKGTQVAPEPVHRTNSGVCFPNNGGGFARQQECRKPLTPGGLLKQAGGAGLAALAVNP